MPSHFSAKTGYAFTALILTPLLGACDLPPAYFAEQLDAVPVPAPVLMRRMPDPDCHVRLARAAAANVANKEGRAAGDDFESESTSAGDAKASAETEKAARPDNAELAKIKKERDCYKRAERVARARLNKLQSETTRTVSALEGVKHRIHPHRMHP